HTIKGDAGCVDLIGVAQIAHKIEDMIDSVVSGESTFKADVVDAILDALDATRAAISGDELCDIDAVEVERICRLLTVADTTAEDEEDHPRATAHLSMVEMHEEAATKAALPASARKADYVRVDTATIDGLLNLAGEMVVARSVMNQVGSEL